MRILSKLLLIFLMPITLYGAAEQTDAAPEPLPADVRRILNLHAPEVGALLFGWNHYVPKPDEDEEARVKVFPWLPAYMLKFGVERVANAHRLREFIQKHELNLLRVPKKYLYHIPAMPRALSNRNYIVVAELITEDEDDGCVVDFPRMEQLCTVALKLPYYDFHSGNFWPLPDGSVVIVDTDDLAMPSPEEVAKRTRHWLAHGVAPYTDHLPADAEDGPVTYNDPLGVLFWDMKMSLFYMTSARKYLMQKIKQQEELRQQLLAQQEADEGLSPASDDSA